MIDADKLRKRAPLIGGLVGALVLGGLPVAFSVWSDQSTGDSLYAATGLLNTTIDLSDSCWQRTTDGYIQLLGNQYVQPGGALDGNNSASDCSSGADATQTMTMPGDNFEYLIPLELDLAGQNMAAQFSVLIEGGASINPPASTAVGFYLATQATDWNPVQQITPAVGQALGQPGVPITLLSLAPGSSELAQDLLVVGSVRVLGDYTWASDFSGSPSGSWTLNSIDTNLIQVRPVR